MNATLSGCGTPPAALTTAVAERFTRGQLKILPKKVGTGAVFPPLEGRLPTLTGFDRCCSQLPELAAQFERHFNVAVVVTATVAGIIGMTFNPCFTAVPEPVVQNVPPFGVCAL